MVPYYQDKQLTIKAFCNLEFFPSLKFDFTKSWHMLDVIHHRCILHLLDKTLQDNINGKRKKFFCNYIFLVLFWYPFCPCLLNFTSYWNFCKYKYFEITFRYAFRKCSTLNQLARTFKAYLKLHLGTTITSVLTLAAIFK